MQFLNSIVKYYSSAYRTVIIAQDNSTKNWYHLFSVIEMKTVEIGNYNIPSSDWHENKMTRSKLKGTTYSYYLLVYELSIDKAVSLFENPIKNDTIDDLLIAYVNNNFIREPTGEFPLIIPSNIYKSDGIASVIPKRSSGSYLWAKIDSERKVEHLLNGLNQKDREAISQLTNDWLGFDIWAQPEHVGNMYLTAANPYFRNFEVSLSTNPIGISYSIHHRKEIEEPIKIRIIDKHGEHIAFDKMYEVSDTRGILKLPHEPHLTQFQFYNSQNDLVAITEPAVFIKNINVGISMKHADLHVQILDDNKEKKEFVVEKYTKEIPSIVGSNSRFNAPYYFKQAEKSRKHIQLFDNNEFQFYPGGKTASEKTHLKAKAAAQIMEIINHARESCYLCDPYFNVKDLVEFAFRVKDSSVKIRIINSKEFIKKDQAKELLNAIEEYNKKPFQEIECRALRGDSILHDRFVIADTNVWFLGSSFSEFGNRATCIAKIPESSNIQIVKEIERWYSQDEYTQPLKEYVETD